MEGGVNIPTLTKKKMIKGVSLIVDCNVNEAMNSLYNDKDDTLK